MCIFMLMWLLSGCIFIKDNKEEKIKQLNSISTPVELVYIRVNTSQKVILQATYDDGSIRDVSQEADYSIINSDIASVNDNGLVEGLQEGNTTLYVEYKDLNLSLPVRIAQEFNSSNFASNDFGI